MFKVLQPFEITHGHTSGVTQDIGQEFDSFFKKNGFSGFGCWPIGGFDNNFAVEFMGIVYIDSLFEGSWNEDITRLMKKYQSL